MSAAPQSSSGNGLDSATADFYRRVLGSLEQGDVPFLVGGAYAFTCYTSIERHTKDLDLFIRRQDYEPVSAVLRRAGYETLLCYPHWLAKVHAGSLFIDIIFSSGNGVCEVDDLWFQHAPRAEVLGHTVTISPVEEMIWSKAFIMERERYDGADVAHLLHARARQLDWARLMQRFDPHWRVLLSHLVLFGFIYPAERSAIPGWVMEDLLERLRHENGTLAPQQRLCAGTLLSREQYLHDVEQRGYQDGRTGPAGTMTPKDVSRWTDAIPDEPRS